MKCAFCGSENQTGELFCGNCGASLDASNEATLVQSASTVADDSSLAIADESNPPVSITPSVDDQNDNATTTTLNAGVTLQDGRYVVEKLLGQGGMGAAVLARDTRVSNKRVVIKELISDETDPEKRQEDVRNFEREVATLAHIDHPLVPSVTDSFQEDTHYYMVQVYVPGENLEDRLIRLGKPLPEKEMLEYTSQTLAILDYLSRQQPPIVHRDIKPANIIISSNDNQVRLVDFGIARADEAKKSHRKQTTALGTPGYAPPEQYQGNADARSDLFALAATVHHLLTNRDPRDEPPFQYPPARSLNPALSRAIEKILQRALTLDINKRYQNAAAMKHDIDEILLDQSTGSIDTTGSLYTRGYAGTSTRGRSAGLSSNTPPPPPPYRPWDTSSERNYGEQAQEMASGRGQQQQMFEPRYEEQLEMERERHAQENISEFGEERRSRRSYDPYEQQAPPMYQPPLFFMQQRSPMVTSIIILMLVIGAILFLLISLSSGSAPAPPPF